MFQESNSSEAKYLFKFQNPFEKQNYHLIVIGSSIEGLACAKEAAKRGAKVCVISNGETFQDLQITLFVEFFFQAIISAEKSQTLAHFYSWNVDSTFDVYKCNWKHLMNTIKLAVKNNLNQKIEYLMHKNVTYVEGNPKFINKSELVVNDNMKAIYFADNFVIAPSGTSVLDKKFPNVKGADLYGITLLDLMNNSEIEGEILVVGDGRTATEVTFLFSKLFKTTLMCKKNPVDEYDNEMMELFLAYINFEILDHSILISISKTKCGRYEVYFTQLNKKWRQIKLFDKIIFIPHVNVKLNKYDLNKTGINATRFEIPTTKNFKSNLPHIYALGRAANNPCNINIMPYQTGRQLAQFLFCKRQSVNNTCDRTGVLLGMPSYCFLGLSEEEAIGKFGNENIDVYAKIFKSYEIMSNVPGVMPNYLKIICTNDDERRVLGMHILAPNAPIIMQGYAAAFRCKNLTMDHIQSHSGIFPTAAREFTELMFTKRSGISAYATNCCN